METRVLMTAEVISVEMEMDSPDGKMADTDEEVPTGALNGGDEKRGVDGWRWRKVEESSRGKDASGQQGRWELWVINGSPKERGKKKKVKEGRRRDGAKEWTLLAEEEWEQTNKTCEGKTSLCCCARSLEENTRKQ